MKDTQTVTGTVWAVFEHRFAVEAKDGRILADLGPKGSEGIEVAVGDTVSFEGERKPSEIKVTSIVLKDRITHAIAWPKKPHDEHGERDPAAAIAAVNAQGYAVEGVPKRKPKHFEIVGAKGGARHEFHVELDGKIRKSKVIAA